MDSTEQAQAEHSNTEQPSEVSDKAVEQSQTFEVNWQTLTWDKLLETYKKLQGEYTKSRQEVSETKKNTELSTEDKAAIDFIKKNWFVTKDDLDNLASSQKQASNLKEIITNNPDLKPFEWAIWELSRNNWIAPEDVIEKYGFKSKDKLAKAKAQGDIMWKPNTAPKSIAEMSSKEYSDYKIKMGMWGSSKFRR